MEIAMNLIDVIVFILCFVYVGGVIFLMKLLKDKLARETRRKLTHMSMGIWPLFWFGFQHHFAAFLVPLIVTIMLALAPKTIRELFSKGEEKHIGLVLYAFSFTVITYFLYKHSAGAAAIFALAFADGFGGWIGRRYGKHTYHVPWSKPKTFEGSLGVFVASAISVIVAQLLFPPVIGPLAIIIGGIIAAAAEGLSPKHSDNIFVPFCLGAFLYYFYWL